jgi:hypothetical protein
MASLMMHTPDVQLTLHVSICVVQKPEERTSLIAYLKKSTA